MCFFSWAEIKQISRTISCDTFVKRNIMKLDDFDREYEEERFIPKHQEAEEEPDLDCFDIRMHKPEEPERGKRDELKRRKKEKNGPPKNRNGLGNV